MMKCEKILLDTIKKKQYSMIGRYIPPYSKESILYNVVEWSHLKPDFEIYDHQVDCEIEKTGETEWEECFGAFSGGYSIPVVIERWYLKIYYQ